MQKQQSIHLEEAEIDQGQADQAAPVARQDEILPAKEHLEVPVCAAEFDSPVLGSRSPEQLGPDCHAKLFQEHT